MTTEAGGCVEGGVKLVTETEQERDFTQLWKSIFQITDEDNRHFYLHNEASVIHDLREWEDGHPLNIKSKQTTEHEYSKPITRPDVTYHINKLKNNAPGNDKIKKHYATPVSQHHQ